MIATFALAASLNAAVFAILDTTLLRPLSVRDEASIVSIGSEWVNFRHSSVSVPEYLDYVERSRTLSPIAALTSASFNLVTAQGVPERVLGARVTVSFFEVLGTAPELGRVFSPADAPGVALVSHRFWMRRLGGDPAAVGQTIRFDGGERLIIGVMPRAFRFPAATTDVWIPLSINPAAPSTRGSHNRLALARLVPGASLARARDEMHAIAKQLAHEHPQVYPPGSGWDVSLLPFREYFFGNFQAPLATLMAAVAFVLLIACAKVANLLVARASDRAAELATRAALGASGVRLARQALIEGLILGGCGGAVGLAAGSGLVRALVAFFPDALPVPDRMLTDPRIALFATFHHGGSGRHRGVEHDAEDLQRCSEWCTAAGAFVTRCGVATRPKSADRDRDRDGGDASGGHGSRPAQLHSADERRSRSRDCRRGDGPHDGAHTVRLAG